MGGGGGERASLGGGSRGGLGARTRPCRKYSLAKQFFPSERSPRQRDLAPRPCLPLPPPPPPSPDLLLPTLLPALFLEFHVWFRLVVRIHFRIFHCRTRDKNYKGRRHLPCAGSSPPPPPPPPPPLMPPI